MNFNNSTTTGHGNDNDQQHQQLPCSRHGDDLGYTDVTDVTTSQHVSVDHMQVNYHFIPAQCCITIAYYLIKIFCYFTSTVFIKLAVPLFVNIV